jgi:hypothetical protein
VPALTSVLFSSPTFCINLFCLFVCFRIWNPDKGAWDITGHAEALKQTSSYPHGSGRALALIHGRYGHCASTPEILNEAHPDSSLSLDALMAPDDVWPDAELPSVLNFIEGRCGDMCQCSECKSAAVPAYGLQIFK